MNQVDVTCVGIAVCDVVTRTVQYPPALGLVQLVDEIGMAEGGCAVRTTRSLAGLEVDTMLIAPIGDDQFGRFLRRSVMADHLDVDWIPKEAPTSASLILVSEGGERTILHRIGANGSLTAEDVRERIQGRILHVGGALVMPSLDGQPLADLLAGARAAGMQTSLDIVHDDTGGWSSVEAALAHTDLFCPNRHEAEAITGIANPKGAAAALRKAGVGMAIVTDGPDGSWLDSDESKGHIAPMEVETIDSTGAGDAFMAGALCGMVRGLSPSQTARLASAMGALATTTTGTFAGPDDPTRPWSMANLEVPQQ